MESNSSAESFRSCKAGHEKYMLHVACRIKATGGSLIPVCNFHWECLKECPHSCFLLQFLSLHLARPPQQPRVSKTCRKYVSQVASRKDPTAAVMDPTRDEKRQTATRTLNQGLPFTDHFFLFGCLEVQLALTASSCHINRVSSEQS